MEQIKKFRKSSLKKSFIYAMLCAVSLIILVSGLTVFGCSALQKIIMPDSGDVILTLTTTYEDGRQDISSHRMQFGSNEELIRLIPDIDDPDNSEQEGITKYSITKIDDSYTFLSPKRKAAYTALSCAMIALPAFYSLVGIVLCAIWFYRKKLDKPIQILSSATENIAKENLDFTVYYESTDEMGRLCDSFEVMRKTLYENNRMLWNMLDERRMLQASVAHDLRNPIAIIEGYAEYLQENIQNGKMTKEKLMNTLSNLSMAAKRLERYTDSIRDIHNLEDLKIQRTPSVLPDLLTEMAVDFTVIAKQTKLTVETMNSVPQCEAMIDKQILYRILENIFTNAMRFAQKKIQISFSLEDFTLIVRIQDDGNGFPDKLLKQKDGYALWTEPSAQHMGMGLVISRILCKKHGGELKLSNPSCGGALIEISISIQ